MHQIDSKEGKIVLHDHRGKLTEKAIVSGHTLVIKSAVQNGFFNNLIAMGLGVNVWNNIFWAKKMGIPVMKPVAVIEKRKWNQVKSFIVYLYEGKVCESEFKTTEEFFPKVQELKEFLNKKGVIHHDFRLRNIVILDDGTLQFIDVDKLHHYPVHSHVFNHRLKREVNRFNLNLLELYSTTKCLVP